MEIDHHIEGDICVIVIHENIENDVAVETRQDVLSLVEENPCKGVALSLEGDGISSLGFGCIIAIEQDFTESNLPLAVFLGPSLHQKFTRANLHRVLDIFTSEEEAINHLRGEEQ